MATTSDPDTSTTDLTQWLLSWGLTKYEQTLRDNGIQSPECFKYIKSDEDFKALVAQMGSGMSFICRLKLRDAWTSMVPNPQKPEPQVLFLGEKEKEIMDLLYQRFDDVSEDVNVVQKAFNEFNETVVRCKQEVNGNADKMISSVTAKKEQLLDHIESIRSENERRFNEVLSKLQRMSQIASSSKDDFKRIASDSDMNSTLKRQQLHELLLFKLDPNSKSHHEHSTMRSAADKEEDDSHSEDIHDEESKQEAAATPSTTSGGADCEDHYKLIGDCCHVPGPAVLRFDESAFNEVMASCLEIQCTEKKMKWTVKPHYGVQSETKAKTMVETEIKMNVETESNTLSMSSSNTMSPQSVASSSVSSRASISTTTPPVVERKKPFRFDVYERYYIHVTQEGARVSGQQSCSYSVVSTATGYNKGVHRWRIMCIENGHHYCNIGVVSKINKLHGVGRTYYDLTDSKGAKCCGFMYIWHDYDGALQGYEKGSLRMNEAVTGAKIKAKDVIEVVLDCNKWTISWIRDKVKVGTLNITEKRTYHPALFTCACPRQQYMLLAGTE